MLYILLPVYNRKNITAKFIAKLKSQTFLDFHLMLIDDGSTDGTSEMVKQEIPNSIILKGDGKLWWAGSLQKGIDWLKKNAVDDDIVLIINDDVDIPKNFLEIGVNVINKVERSLLIALNLDSYGNIIDAGSYINWSKLLIKKCSINEEINVCSTRGLMCRVGDIFTIGDFHPKILPHYGSDYEYTYRAYKKGYSLIRNSNFYLFENKAFTGNRKRAYEYSSLKQFFNEITSNKSLSNPKIWLGLIRLACPTKYKLINYIKVIKNFIFLFIKVLLYRIAYNVRRIFYFGNNFYCNFCGSKLRKFLPYGADIRIMNKYSIIGAGFRNTCICPVCKSKDRERHIKFLIDKKIISIEGKKILHVAPEFNLTKFLASKGIITKGDKFAKGYSYSSDVIELDITNLYFSNEEFDVIICNHVLEHIDNDLIALQELYRVLKKGGFAILQVPISFQIEETIESNDNYTEEEREFYFGQRDYVRIYGKDYITRLEAKGFEVEVLNFYNQYKDEYEKLGLIYNEPIFVCWKR